MAKGIKKGTKFVGSGEQSDVLLDAVIITYQVGLRSIEDKYPVMNRVEVTEFIDPTTGVPKVPIEFLTEHVVGLKSHVEENYQKRQITKLELGLKEDRYQVEYRRQSNMGKRVERIFKPNPLSAAINNRDGVENAINELFGQKTN